MRKMNEQEIAAYLARIGYEGPVQPTAATLRMLQTCHVQTVPYENLDILKGKELSLAPEDVYDKVVTKGRGGYCFELNALFAWLLRSMGYTLDDLFARFVLGESEVPKRRHHVLRVHFGADSYIADVGVGLEVPRQAVLLQEGVAYEQTHGTYRFRREALLGWVLEEEHQTGWRDVYAFTEEPQLPIDYSAIHYYCQHAPDSPFNKEAMVAIKTSEGRITLDGNMLKFFRGGSPQVEILEEEEAVAQALCTHFGIVIR